jgi:hypothetical protein
MKSWNEIYDPCPVNPKQDGLDIDWKSFNYVNPPFADIRQWLRKMKSEKSKGKTSLMLLPARTHAVYFLEEMWQSSDHIYILTNNVRFESYTHNFPLPVMLVLYGRPHGRAPILSFPRDGYQYRSLPAGILDIRTIEQHDESDWDALANFLTRSSKYDSVTVKATSALALGLRTCNLVMVLSNNLDIITAVVDHHHANKASKTVILVMSQYQTGWMRKLIAAAHSLIAISPPLTLDKRIHKRRSLSGSTLFILGGTPDGFPLQYSKRITFVTKICSKGNSKIACNFV